MTASLSETIYGHTNWKPIS